MCSVCISLITVVFIVTVVEVVHLLGKNYKFLVKNYKRIYETYRGLQCCLFFSVFVFFVFSFWLSFLQLLLKMGMNISTISF